MRNFTDTDGFQRARVLDMFGDFEDQVNLRDVFCLAFQDSLAQGSTEVTMFSTLPELRRFLRSLGFWFSVKKRFCWLSESSTAMERLWRRIYWTYADDDNDGRGELPAEEPAAR
jgi:hypothetical protein